MAHILLSMLEPLPDKAALIAALNRHTATIFASGALLLAAAHCWPRLNYLFQCWRLDRRRALNPNIFHDELEDYSVALGDPPEPIRVGRVVGNAVLGGALFGMPALLNELHLRHWYLVLWLGFAACIIIGSVRRSLQDPPVQRSAGYLEVPDPGQPMLVTLSAMGILIFLVGVVVMLAV